MRHGKSDWHAGASSDHERPINDRGRRESADAAHFLIENDAVPDVVLCSSALRTRQTWSVACETAQWESVRAHVLDELYLCSPGAAMECIGHYSTGGGRLMLVGHQPTLSGLVSMLTDGRSVDMPTASVAIIRADMPVAPHKGTLVSLYHPKKR